MTDHRKESGRNLTPWIAALIAILAIGAIVYFVGRNQTDDNLVPSATAIDPRSGALTATGTAAEGATGTDMGTAAPPPVGGVAPGASADATFSDGGASGSAGAGGTPQSFPRGEGAEPPAATPPAQ